MSSAEESENQKRELLAILSATLWVLEHPEVNAIKFCGDPRELAQRIRRRMDQNGMGPQLIDARAAAALGAV
jgi:hypothetical protein